MYAPIKDFLVRQGYDVRSEVRGCDVVAEKDGEMIVLEMKSRLSVALLAQAAARQKAVDSVYVVVPHPGSKVRSKDWRNACHLVRRLELGLILVGLPPLTVSRKNAEHRDLVEDQAREASVEIAFHPIPFERKKRKGERLAIIREFRGRSVDCNQGGSPGGKLVTAYRENAVRIACFLSVLGPSAPARLREFGTGPKTLSILYDNYYRWFERVGRGVYALASRGAEEAAQYEALWSRHLSEAEAASFGQTQNRRPD